VVEDREQNPYARARRARKRAKERKGFYTHAMTYVLVNIGLFVINLLAGGGWWFYWPLIGWGIGLGVHALSVFWFGQDGEERKTRQLMENED
jgi:fatty acid desaturase